MNRAIGALVVLGLIGGAVWIGLNSERQAATSRVAGVHQLIRQLSDHGFGCSDVETDLPGALGLGDATLALCEIEDSSATLYVFRGSSARFAEGYEAGTVISWVVGENWVVVVDRPELAIAIAEALDADALYDRALLTGRTSVPRCDEDILFEPTRLPKGFGHEQFQGRFPGGRPPDDQSSIGGKPHEEQVIVHYRGAGGRAIEIRRPGTLFSELAQRSDAPRIEVLGTETTGFAPIEPGGNNFIVQFHYPSVARPHQWCSLYSLNEYGVSLAELKKVAIGLRPRLPDAVEDVRAAMLEAAEDGDYERLRPILQPGTFLSDFGYGVDPFERWAKMGRKPLDLMAALLRMDHVTENSNEGQLIRWPAYDAETKSLAAITERDRQLFLSVMPPKGFRNLVPNDEYGYVGPRLGILADGTWWFFIMEPGP